MTPPPIERQEEKTMDDYYVFRREMIDRSIVDKQPPGSVEIVPGCYYTLPPRAGKRFAASLARAFYAMRFWTRFRK